MFILFHCNFWIFNDQSCIEFIFEDNPPDIIIWFSLIQIENCERPSGKFLWGYLKYENNLNSPESDGITFVFLSSWLLSTKLIIEISSEILVFKFETFILGIFTLNFCKFPSKTSMDLLNKFLCLTRTSLLIWLNTELLSFIIFKLWKGFLKSKSFIFIWNLFVDKFFFVLSSLIFLFEFISEISSSVNPLDL